MLKQQSGCRPNFGKAVVTGTVTAVAVAFLCAAALAKLVDGEFLKMEHIGYGVLISHLLAVMLGTRRAMTGEGKDGTLGAVLTGAAYYLSLLIINGLFFGGSFTGLGVTLVLVALGTLASILAGGKGRGRKGRRRYKIPK